MKLVWTDMINPYLSKLSLSLRRSSNIFREKERGERESCLLSFQGVRHKQLVKLICKMVACCINTSSVRFTSGDIKLTNDTRVCFHHKPGSLDKIL